jgi:hypothetical protein
MTENTVASRSNSAATRPVAANVRRRGRPSKAALGRLKVSAMVVAVAAFAGSLGAIAVLNPGIKQASASTSTQVAPFNIVVPGEPVAPQINSAPLQLPQPSQQSQLFMPRTRTRGS